MWSKHTNNLSSTKEIWTKEVKMADMVNHPVHYTSHPSGVETIEITEHMKI
jgi:hypothetical protein